MIAKIINKEQYQKKVLKKIILKTDPSVYLLFTPIKLGSLMEIANMITNQSAESVNVYNRFCDILVDHAVGDDGEKIFVDRDDLERTIDGIDIQYIGEKLVELSGFIESEKKDSAETQQSPKLQDSESG